MDIAESSHTELPDSSPYTERDCGLKAAVPMDDSYCFYYRENIECLEASGFDVTTFRPTDGDPLPDADLYYLGGGYPELYAERLSSNTDYLEGLRTASEDGIYSSEMTFTDGDRQVVLDARTSDAVSIAMRTGAPIYTTPAIVDECGIELEEVTTATDNDDVDDDDEETADDGLLVAPDPETVDLPDGVEENLDDETLQRRMQFFAEHDDYESAMRIRAILAARGKNASNG